MINNVFIPWLFSFSQYGHQRFGYAPLPLFIIVFDLKISCQSYQFCTNRSLHCGNGVLAFVVLSF